MRAPRDVLLATLSAVVLALGACGGGDGDEPDEDGARAGSGVTGTAADEQDAEQEEGVAAELRQAGLDTLAAGPAVLEGEVSVAPGAADGPEAVAYTVGGSIDLATGRTALVLDLAHIFGDADLPDEIAPYIRGQLVVVRQDGAVTHLCGAVYEAFAGTFCVREDAGATPGASGAPGAFASGLSFDVALHLLGDLDEVEDVGVERLLGTSLRHRAGTLDLAAAASGLPADVRLSLDRTLASLGTTVDGVAGPAAVDVWTDADGRVRQVALEVTKDGEDAATRTFVSRFVRFGVDPALPTLDVPGEVTDAAAVAWP